MELKYNHFDVSIRELTGTALSNLAPLDPEYFINTVIPHLIPLCLKPDILTSHGALFSLGSILVSLKKCEKLDLKPEVVGAIRDIVPTLINKHFINASLHSNAMLRLGLNHFVKCIALSKYVTTELD